ncbi:MBL fold metallo-hydrolase [Virgibacillus sp. YIM 98842]|uniref:MBL fold metallo-hydrolase n=1 Tax=Virgibacillus sp. YIM 98842 TaxID=2663533 RepID=UPI0013D97DC4|nr:MBL fold metallo-hydrolase [Virgibacillus sp. YIM 98842]
MKLTVVGFWGGYPAKNGATSCYLLEKDDFSFIIDAGSSSLSKLQNYLSPANLDAVIISHYHQDHIADIGVLQYARLVNYYVTGDQKVLPVYGHKEDRAGFQSLTHKYTKGVAFDPDSRLELGPFSITFLKTKHPVPCYGMRITDGEKTIVYTADTSYKEEWIDFAAGADLLIADCNFYAGGNASQAGHMTSEEGGKIAAASAVKELMLSHLPQFGNRQQLIEEAKQFFQGKIRLAEEGLVWT